MKKHIIIILLMPLLFSCSTKTKETQADENIALIEKYVSAVENLDYVTMLSLLSDDYCGYGPSFNDSIGKDHVMYNWRYNSDSLYKSIKYIKSRNASLMIKDGAHTGEWVSNWGQLHIVYKEDNKEVTIWTNTIYQIENDKIVKSYSFYNEADVFEQLGFIFINPSTY